MKKIALLLVTLCMVSGCATRLSSNVVPAADINNLGEIYVARFSPDKRHLNKIIAEELRDLGRIATAGEANEQPKKTDTLITYTDRWRWDITNYMISLDIQVVDAKKGTQIADVHNMRTSLARKSPRGMIRGALFDLFGLENPDDVQQSDSPEFN